jgi:tetratricopeptide (TPR) repeat protein/tRNA A-37 threonylcarbamoyl transferase component Bud32
LSSSYFLQGKSSRKSEASLIGRTISHYQITEKIGEGAMGEVYLAHDIKLHRAVALKFIPEALVHEGQRLARFEREARLLASLNHPNIAAIHAVEEYDGKPFLVMELVEGETLADRLVQGALPIPDVLRLAQQIAEALKAAHKKGIIHRDLKPANIKITPDGVVKVLDFGLAKQFQDASEEIDTEAATLHAVTMAGGMIGTPAYMSPEQALGQTADTRADIFSFGAILYEVLTGQRAFAGPTLGAILKAVLSTNPPSPRRLRPEVPVEIDAVVMKALNKKKELRQQTADELCTGLAQANATLTSHSLVAASPVRAFRDLAWRLRTWRTEHQRAAFVVTTLLVVVVLGSIAAVALKRRAAVAGPLTSSSRINPAASSYELFQQGMAYLERYDKTENIDAAMQAFQSALAKDQKYAPAYAGLGTAYLVKYQANRDKQLLDTAFENAKQAVDLNGQLADDRVSLGRVLVEKGEYDKAEVELKQALTVDPLNASAHRGLGDVERGRKNWAEAEKFYKKAIELRPKDWDLHFALGNFYFRQSRYADAEKAFTDVVKLVPDCHFGYRSLGGIYHMQGRFADASAEYQKALQIKPSAITYSNLGTSLFYQGLYQQSVVAMEKAVEMSANNVQNWINLGDAYRWTPGNEEKAKETYRTAIEMIRKDLSGKPNDADLRSRLALCLAKSGEKRQALAEAAAVEALDRSAPVLSRLVSVYEVCGQRRQALDTMAAALKAGYSLDEFRRDPELLELRKDPGFLQLVAAASEKPHS